MNQPISSAQSNPDARDLRQVLAHAWRGAWVPLATDGIVGPVAVRGAVGCAPNRIGNG